MCGAERPAIPPALVTGLPACYQPSRRQHGVSCCLLLLSRRHTPRTFMHKWVIEGIGTQKWNCTQRHKVMMLQAKLSSEISGIIIEQGAGRDTSLPLRLHRWQAPPRKPCLQELRPPRCYRTLKVRRIKYGRKGRGRASENG